MAKTLLSEGELLTRLNEMLADKPACRGLVLTRIIRIGGYYGEQPNWDVDFNSSGVAFSSDCRREIIYAKVVLQNQFDLLTD